MVKANLYYYKLPDGWRLVAKKAVEHPDNHRVGALVQAEISGIYSMYCGNVFSSVPQDFARKIDMAEQQNKLKNTEQKKKSIECER